MPINSILTFISSFIILGLLFVFPANTKAELPPNRSLYILDSNGGAVTQHQISFQFPDNSTVGSMVLQYCTSPVEDIPCVSPAGMDASGAIFANQGGETGFSILSQTANTFILTRPPSVVTPAPQQNIYTFNNITNPSNVGTFYLRINTYASVDGSGPKIDFGGTAAAITTGVSISAEVPPILYFCAAVLIDNISCATAEGNYLNLGTLTHTRAAVGTSRFAASTNANFGYVVQVFGSTMSSGNNVLPALTTPTASSPGTRQFGINLRANTSPAVGEEYTGVWGVISSDYNIPNMFVFRDGDTLAYSPFISLFEVFTVTYMVNIQEFQPAGVYNTLLNYVCTATF